MSTTYHIVRHSQRGEKWMVKKVFFNSKSIQRFYFNGKEFTLLNVDSEQPMPNYVPVKQVLIEPTIITIKTNQQVQLKAIIIPENATNQEILWQSSNTGFATVTEDGLVTTYLEGELIVVAVSKDNNTIRGVATIKISNEQTQNTDIEEVDTLGIGICTEIDEMIVREEIGIMARLLPHTWWRDNPYTLRSSDETIATVKNNIVTALSPGEVTITAETLDGQYSDQLSFKVVMPKVESISAEKIYTIELDKFHILPDIYTKEQAQLNVRGINYALLYAASKGYKKIVLPLGNYYVYPSEPIYGRSNLIFDLNGSTLQIFENTLDNYVAFSFKEGDAPNLILNIIEAENKQVLDTFLGETEVNSWMVNDTINREVRTKKVPVKIVTDTYIEDFLQYGKQYKFSFRIAKKDTVITTPSSSTVKVYIEYYKENRVISKVLLQTLWISSNTAQFYSNSSIIINLPLEKSYDAIGFMFETTLNNVNTQLYLASMTLSMTMNKVLENFKMCNGTLIGERDTKANVYPNWRNIDKTEGGCTIVFEEGKFNGIENMTVKKSVGFNMSSGIGASSYGTSRLENIISYKNLEYGKFDENGEKVEDSKFIRTINPIQLKNITKFYSLDLPLGYMGYPYESSRIYDIYFYNNSNELIACHKNRLKFGQYTLPEGSIYAHAVFHNSNLPTSGNSDFNGAVISINSYRPPYKNFIKNCIVEDNYSTGLALCGGVNWQIEGNVFRNNAGRMPGCDIDWEDGWEFMQNDSVRDNRFESYNSLIICAGSNMIFKRNAIYGKVIFYGRTQDMKFCENTVDATGKTAITCTFDTQSNMYVNNNMFIGTLVGFTRQHTDSKAQYQPAFHDNKLINTGIGNIYFDIYRNSFEATKGEITILYLPTKGIKAYSCTFAGSKKIVLNVGYLINCIFTGAHIFSKQEQLQLVNCALENTIIYPSGIISNSIIIQGCNIITSLDQLVSLPTRKVDLRIVNSRIVLNNLSVNLIYGYNLAGCSGVVQLENSVLETDANVQGYILKANWFATTGDILTINLVNTPTKLPLSDIKGLTNNFIKFNVN